MLDHIKERYRRFAETECRGYSDLYYRLARGAADDDAVMRFIADKPVPQPNLFFAAIQYVVGPDAMPDTSAELRAVLAHHGAAIAEIMRTRRTQTNEVGRCAVLLPALPIGPLALVEVGASAGLCLLIDRFFYDYGSVRIGDASSVRLQCALTGSVPLPVALPDVVWRRGLDIEPVDLRDEAAVRWLLACVWADHRDRRERLEAAIRLGRGDAPLVTRGDLVDDLSSLLALAPRAATLVVFHSAVLPYVRQERRDAFAEVLAETSTRRDVVWISNESPGLVARLEARAPVVNPRRFLVGRTTFRDRVGRDEVLGLAHPHGRELQWLA
jgi:hypothetical protein